jgi:hypothetical protein
VYTWYLRSVSLVAHFKINSKPATEESRNVEVLDGLVEGRGEREGREAEGSDEDGEHG